MARRSRRTVRIAISDVPGKSIFIVGSFNNWDPEVKALVDKKGEGVYRAQLLLAPGTYQYKLVIDGEWHLDEENPNLVPNQFSGFNNVLTVEADK